MNKIKPTIFTLLSIGFLTLALQMVITDFQLVGFDKTILVTISGVMAGIMFLASWSGWNNALNKKPESHKVYNSGLLRSGKVIFASYAVAFASSLIIIVVGTWIFGFAVIDKFITTYMTYTVIGITVSSIPLVSKYLK